MREIFKDVPGWPKYQVSNKGRVRRKAGLDSIGRFWPAHFKQLKRRYYVKLTDRPRSWEGAVARLILLTFVGPPPSKDSHARHLDDVRANNCLENLAWGSAWDNAQDKIRNGRTTKGIPRPLEVRRKIGLAQRGKVIALEHRQKISQAHKGKVLTPEHREKIRQSMLGKNSGPRSLKKRTKISAIKLRNKKYKKKLE